MLLLKCAMSQVLSSSSLCLAANSLNQNVTSESAIIVYEYESKRIMILLSL